MPVIALDDLGGDGQEKARRRRRRNRQCVACLVVEAGSKRLGLGQPDPGRVGGLNDVDIQLTYPLARV